MKTFVAIVIFLAWLPTYAQVQLIGGTLNDHRRALTTRPGNYLNEHEFVARYYLRSRYLAQMPATIRGFLYRKRDNLLMETLDMVRDNSFEKLNKLAQPCGDAADSIYQVGYKILYEFAPARFDDVQGYYLVTQPLCCRAYADNLVQNGTPMVLYMEMGPANAVPESENNMNAQVYYIPGVLQACAGKDIFNSIRTDGGANFAVNTIYNEPPLTGSQEKENLFEPVNFKPNSPTQVPLIGVVNLPPGTYTYVLKADATIRGRTGKYSETRQEFQLIVRDCGATTKPTIFVSKVGKPTIASPITVCQDSLVQLNLRNFSRNSAIQWQLGGNDLANAKDSILIVKNNQGGVYTATAREQDNQCAEKVTTDPVTISFLPNPSVNVSTNNNMGALCQGGSIQLTATTSTFNATFQWFKGGVPIAGATMGTLSASETASYTVKVTNPIGCSGLSQPINIATNTPPKADITATTTAICQGQSTTLSANTGTGLSYQWRRDGLPIAGATNATYTTTQIGNYTVIVTASTGCNTTSTGVTLNLSPNPTVTITSPSTQVCPNGSLLLTANGPNLSTYQWLLDGQPIAGATMSTYNAAKTGAYSVRANNASGCTGTSPASTIGAAPALAVSITAPSTQVCEGGSLLLTANGSNLSTYQWLLDGQPIAGATMATYNAAQAGNYTLRAANAASCSGVSPITAIKTIAKIKIVIDAVPNFCGTAHNVVMLRATPAGGLFSGNGVVGSTFDPKTAGIGQHTITYTIMGALECLSGNAQQTIAISAPPVLDLGPDVTINTGGSVRLNGTIGPGYAYFWSPQSSLDNPTIATPLASPTATTTYRLRATNSSGCVVEDTIRIRVIQQIFVPTGFSPNGDGINDTWVLRGIESYADTEVRIYNRWGQLVFYSKNYPIPFDGTYNGNPLPTGIYIYTISTGSGPTLRGSFMLIR